MLDTMTWTDVMLFVAAYFIVVWWAAGDFKGDE